MDIITRQQARELNLKYYFTGKPCVNDHLTNRFVSTGGCVSCLREHDSRTRSKHKETARVYRQTNKERIAARNKEWRHKNPAAVRASRQKNYDPVYYAARYQRNKDHVRQVHKLYREMNAALYASLSARRRATMRRATPSWFEADAVEAIYVEAVTITASTGVDHEVDHIVPLSSDIVCGLHCLANLRVITAEANRKKSNTFTIG